MLTTVMEALPVLPSLVALIGVDPAARPITRPFPFTVAIAPLVLAHVTTGPTTRPRSHYAASP